jgi:hypothetical protein
VLRLGWPGPCLYSGEPTERALSVLVQTCWGLLFFLRFEVRWNPAGNWAGPYFFLQGLELSSIRIWDFTCFVEMDSPEPHHLLSGLTLQEDQRIWSGKAAEGGCTPCGQGWARGVLKLLEKILKSTSFKRVACVSVSLELTRSEAWILQVAPVLLVSSFRRTSLSVRAVFGCLLLLTRSSLRVLRTTSRTLIFV